MREIKFRAWEEENKRWLTSYEECYLCEDGTVAYMKTSGGNWETYDYIHKTKAIPCLYTGLKDKNGKEIYEGDLGYFDIAPKNLIEIKIEEGAVSYWSLFNMGHKFEIIGNIYEHPHLLNRDQNVQVSDTTEAK